MGRAAGSLVLAANRSGSSRSRRRRRGALASRTRSASWRRAREGHHPQRPRVPRWAGAALAHCVAASKPLRARGCSIGPMPPRPAILRGRRRGTRAIAVRRPEAIGRGRRRGADSVAAHLVADVPLVFSLRRIDRRRSAASGSGRSASHYTVRSTTVAEHEYAGLVASTSPQRTTSSCSILAHRGGSSADSRPPISRRSTRHGFYVSRMRTRLKAVLWARRLRAFGGIHLAAPSAGSVSTYAWAMSRRWVRPFGDAARSLSERWQHFMAGNGRIDVAYRTQRGLFMPAELERLAGPALRDRWVPTAARVAAAESVLFGGAAPTLEGDVSRLETRVYLGAQLLRDLDVMSMAHGLEVRVPFVDHVLVDASAVSARILRCAHHRCCTNAAPAPAARDVYRPSRDSRCLSQLSRRAASVRAVGHRLPCRVG